MFAKQSNRSAMNVALRTCRRGPVVARILLAGILFAVLAQVPGVVNSDEQVSVPPEKRTVQGGNDQDMLKFLKSDGALAEQIVFQDVQSGAPGLVGTKFVVQRDGTWNKFFVHGTREIPKGNGKLTSQDLSNIAAVLVAEHFDALPEKLGDDHPDKNPNPHYVKIAFGKERKQIELPSRVELEDFVKQAKGKDRESIERFDAIVKSISAMVGDDRSESTRKP
jgi:hypothetical protein